MNHNDLFADSSDEEDDHKTKELMSNTENSSQQNNAKISMKELFGSDDSDESSSEEKKAPATTKQVYHATGNGGGGGGKRLRPPVGGGGKELKPAPLLAGSSDSDDNDLFAESSDEEKVNTKNIIQQNLKRKASTTHDYGVNHQRNLKRRVVLPEYDDKEKALVAVKQNGLWLRNRSERLRDDKDVVLAAIQQYPNALQFASDRLKNDPQVVTAAVTSSKYGGSAIRYASPALLENDRNLVLSLVNTEPWCFHYLPSSKLKDDKEIVLAAIKKDSRQVAFASERLQSGDRDVILAASSNSLWLEQKLRLYQWTTRDREIMLKAVRSNGTLLRFASEEICNDREVVAAAIESGWIGARGSDLFGPGNDVGWLGGLLTEELLADRALNLLAAKRCGGFLNVELCKQDREIALEGVSRNARVFRELPEALQADYEIAMTVVSNKGGCKHFPDMPAEFRGDRNIVLAALQGSYRGSSPRWFASASVELRSDPDIALKAVRRNGLFLRDVVIDGTGTRDLEIVKAAIAGSASAFRFAPPGFDSHPEVVAEALRGCRDYSCDDDREEHFDFVRRNAGESLMKKLTAINDEYELGEGNNDKIQVSEHQDVKKWSREWKGVLWHKVWLLEKMIPTGADVRANILQFADILPDFRLARKIVEVGPVVEALAEMDKGVDDIVNDDNDDDHDG